MHRSPVASGATPKVHDIHAKAKAKAKAFIPILAQMHASIKSLWIKAFE